MRTGINESTLVRSTSLKHVSSISPSGMEEFSESSSWIHFRNKTGLVLSVRRYLGGSDEFPDLQDGLKGEGDKTQFPKGLVEALDKANVFSSEGGDENKVTITLRPGRLRIRGDGALGWYTESKKIRWDGDELSFYISPKLLSDLVQRQSEVTISKNKLLVNGTGPYVYAAALGVPEVNEKEIANGNETED